MALAAAALVLLGLYKIYRQRATGAPERLAIDDLGLELMVGCCAFVVFTSPSCRACKAAVALVNDLSRRASGPTEVRTVDATVDPEIALRYGVRTIPTVFLITASGHVVNRWIDVPDPLEVRDALDAM